MSQSDIRSQPIGQSVALAAPPILRLRVNFLAQEVVNLPQFAGSTWRGVLGHAFKKVVCVTTLPECRDCALLSTCPYPYLFETAPPRGSDRMRRYDQVPHPYVIRVPKQSGRVEAGEFASFELVLVGRAMAYGEELFAALERVGAMAPGKGSGRLKLDQVHAFDWGRCTWEPIAASSWLPGTLVTVPTIPVAPPDGPVSLVLETPLRLRRDNRNVQPSTFTFRDLFTTVMRRVSMLAYFHGGQDMDLDYRALAEQSGQVALTVQDLGWQDWARYSTRQGRSVPMGGLVGRVTAETSDWARFWPLLWLGQWLHAGKGTVMGLGRYRIESPAMAVPTTLSVAQGGAASE